MVSGRGEVLLLLLLLLLLLPVLTILPLLPRLSALHLQALATHEEQLLHLVQLQRAGAIVVEQLEAALQLGLRGRDEEHAHLGCVGVQPRCMGLQPRCMGLQPRCVELQPGSMGLQS